MAAAAAAELVLSGIINKANITNTFKEQSCVQTKDTEMIQTSDTETGVALTTDIVLSQSYLFCFYKTTQKMTFSVFFCRFESLPAPRPKSTTGAERRAAAATCACSPGSRPSHHRPSSPNHEEVIPSKTHIRNKVTIKQQKNNNKKHARKTDGYSLKSKSQRETDCAKYGDGCHVESRLLPFTPEEDGAQAPRALLLTWGSLVSP